MTPLPNHPPVCNDHITVYILSIFTIIQRALEDEEEEVQEVVIQEGNEDEDNDNPSEDEVILTHAPDDPYYRLPLDDEEKGNVKIDTDLINLCYVRKK